MGDRGFRDVLHCNNRICAWDTNALLFAKELRDDFSGFDELPVRAQHCALTARLPMHHRDRSDDHLPYQAMAGEPDAVEIALDFFKEHPMP